MKKMLCIVSIAQNLCFANTFLKNRKISCAAGKGLHFFDKFAILQNGK
jgi:hypothetical protein